MTLTAAGPKGLNVNSTRSSLLHLLPPGLAASSTSCPGCMAGEAPPCQLPPCRCCRVPGPPERLPLPTPLQQGPNMACVLLQQLPGPHTWLILAAPPFMLLCTHSTRTSFRNT